MKNLKTFFIIAILISAFSISSSAQKYSKIKIKTSVRSETGKNIIEKGLLKEKGVVSADVDKKLKIVVVKYKSKVTDANKIRKSISKLGYKADNIKADKVAYSKLPKECKKPTKSYRNDCGHDCGHSCGG